MRIANAVGMVIFILGFATLVFIAAAPESVLVRTGLAEARHWRAVKLAEGEGTYGVALCTDSGRCAKSGAGLTGYRFNNVEDAKERALELEAIRTRGDLNPVMVP